jgi:hypothetical protein
MFLFVGNVFAQTLEEKFKQQRSQIIEAPRSEVLTDLSQIWRTLEKECNWYHIGPKKFTTYLSGTPFRLLDGKFIKEKNGDGWEFDPRWSPPYSELPLICVYQNAVWGSIEANEWRGRKFTCDNDATKLVKGYFYVPYVYTKLDDTKTANIKLPSAFNFRPSGLQTVAQYEINFKNKTCFYQKNNSEVEECKLALIDTNKISPRFIGNIFEKISDEIVKQCSNN